MRNKMRKPKFDIEEVREFIENSSMESKIYIGTDSESYKRHGVWYADFYMVVVIHKDGRHGCKVFGEKVTERDYTTNKKKPSYRLMSEVYKTADLYLKLIDVVGDREIEVHLDINPDKKHASSLVVDQAIGYIKGTCNVTPMVKPFAFAASYAADRLIRTGSRG